MPVRREQQDDEVRADDKNDDLEETALPPRRAALFRTDV